MKRLFFYGARSPHWPRVHRRLRRNIKRRPLPQPANTPSVQGLAGRRLQRSTRRHASLIFRIDQSHFFRISPAALDRLGCIH